VIVWIDDLERISHGKQETAEEEGQQAGNAEPQPKSAWRKFERAVALIAQPLTPIARVKSPDLVNDVA
jgi:hypothetical protein